MVNNDIDFGEVLAALHQINMKILSDSSRKQKLNLIVEEARKVFHANSCDIHIFDPVTRSFMRSATAGLSKKWKHSPRRRGIGFKAIRTGVSVWEQNPKKLNPVVRKLGITCVGAFPLQPKGGGDIGILYGHFRKNPRYDKKQHKIFELFSYHAGLAISIARLRESDQMRIKDLELLRLANLKIIRAGTLRESLERVTAEARAVMHADYAILLPWDQKKGKRDEGLIVAAGRDSSKRLKFSRPRKKGLNHIVMERGLFYEPDLDAVSDKREKLLKVARKELFDPHELKAFIGVALKSQDEELGVLYVAFSQLHEPNEEQLSTIRIFAHHAMMSILLDRLVEIQRSASQAEHVIELTAVAAELAHTLGNKAGTIPLVVSDIEKRFQALGINKKDPLFKRFNDLKADVKGLMGVSNQLKVKDYVKRVVPLDISLVVAQARRDAELESIAPGITVNPEIPPKLPKVRGVKSFLVDTVVNLLQNAVQAEADVISIKVIDNSNVSGTIGLVISDNGRGITEEEMEKIFLPFSSSRKPEKDSGFHIGLWVSKYLIVNLMQGDISVESEVGKGSRFTVTLKVAIKEQ